MSKKYSVYRRPLDDIKIENRFIPKGLVNRTGNMQVPKYIVIHETSLGLGKTPKSKDMDNYEQLLYQYAERNMPVGYHYCVSDSEVWQFIPDDERTSQTGKGTLGNLMGIGIERLVNEVTDRNKSIHIQAKLSATLMIKWDIPLENVLTHRAIQHASNYEQKKDCPSRMLAGQYGGTTQFYAEVLRCIQYGWIFEDHLSEDKLAYYKNLLNDSNEKNIYMCLFTDSILTHGEKFHDIQINDSGHFKR